MISGIKERLLANKNERIILIFAIIFNLICVFFHECWRDEAQAWLIARDASIFDYGDIITYEGHPFLWFLILFPFARLGFPFFTIKIISFIVMTITAYVILFMTELPFPVKSLFVLSPFYLYFFTVPARNYCLCALLLVITAYYYRSRHEKTIQYMISLAILLQTHLIVAGFVFMSCLCFFIESLISAKKQIINPKELGRRFCGLLIPFGSGLLLLAEVGSNIGKKQYFNDNVGLFGVLKKIMDMNLTICIRLFGDYGYILMALAVAVIVMICIRNHKACYCAAILLFSVCWQSWMYIYVVNSGNQRYMSWGYLFIVFIIETYDKEDHILNFKIDKITAGSLIMAVFLTISYISLWRVHSSYISNDYTNKYSEAADAADRINKLPQGSLIVENCEDFCNSVLPYLITDKVYNPFLKRGATYCDRDPDKRHNMSFDELKAELRSDFPEYNGFYYLCYLEYTQISNQEEALSGLEPVATADEYNLIRENYKIYYIPF